MTENNEGNGNPSNLEEALRGSFSKGSHVTPDFQVPSNFVPPSASLTPKVSGGGDQSPSGASGSND